MARIPSPWFWQERNGWYVTKNGVRHFLGENPLDNPTPKKTKGKWKAPPSIMEVFHALLARKYEESIVPKTNPSRSGFTVPEILDKYLDWCQKHRAPKTYEWYRDHIQGFLDSLANPTELMVVDLKPFHIIDWVDSHSHWSAAYKRGAIVAVQRPFNWAEQLGYIATNPIKKIEKPQPQRRDNLMTQNDFDKLLARVKEGDPFRDLLQFVWHTGCRPQEVRHIEPRHVQLTEECIIIPKNEAKGKKRPRIIHLNGPALEIIKKLMPIRTSGKLFLNLNGQPWKKFALCNRFDRLCLALSIRELKDAGITFDPIPRFNRRVLKDRDQLAAARKEHQKKLRERRKEIYRLARAHGKGFAAYDLRHAFVQRLLENGANHLVVAELLGHSNGTMVSQVYSHMNRATVHLKETLRKASGGGDAN